MPVTAIAAIVRARTVPQYELRVRNHGPEDLELEVWQVPAPVTPQLTAPIRLAGLRGRNLALIEHRVLRRLYRTGICLVGLSADEVRIEPVDEETALHLGLLFRTLAPLRCARAVRACADGLDEMSREEAAYWLGMAMHRPNPRRVLSALRTLLSGPEPRR